MSSDTQNVPSEGKNCFVKFSSGVNVKFETCFDKVGNCIFRFPLAVLLGTFTFFGISCYFVSEIEATENLLELILGEDSVVVQIYEWRRKYLWTSDWGLCSETTDDPTSSRRRTNCGDVTSVSLEDTVTSSGISGSLVIMGVDHEHENILKPEYLLAYEFVFRRFLREWTTTCDQYPGLDFGYKDIARWEYFDENYMAVANFPLDNIGLLRCFQEGNWSSPENNEDVLEFMPVLKFSSEYEKKPSLNEILNSGMTSEEQTKQISIAIQSCWVRLQQNNAAFPFGYMIGGMQFPAYSTNDMPEIGDQVLVDEGVNEWLAGVIVSRAGNTFAVNDAQSNTTSLRTNVTIEKLRKTMTKAVGTQTLFWVGQYPEFAKRIQKQHYELCEVTGQLKGRYNCTLDNSFTDIYKDAEDCQRKIVNDLATAIRTANDEEKFLIDIAVFTPYDEENVLKHASSTGETILITCLCIMIVFVGIIAANPWKRLQSKTLIGAIGVVLVFFSTMAGMGLCRLLFQFDFTPASMQALPFMGLGLGVDDMLVLLWTYDYQRKSEQVNSEICRAVREAGLSITLTSITNFVSFFIGSTMPLKELSYFSWTASCIIFTNYVGVLLGFSALLVLHNMCILKPEASIVTAEGGITRDLDISGLPESHSGSRKIKTVSEWCLKIGPASIILIISLTLLVIALFVSPRPEWGVSLNELIPDNHPMKSFFVYWEKWFNTMTTRLGFGFVHENGGPAVKWGNYYSVKYKEILGFYSDISALPTVTMADTWIRSFRRWVSQDPAVSYENIPEEDQASINILDYVHSTGNPSIGACNDGTYALCSLFDIYVCVDELLCSQLGGMLCSDGVTCSSCQILLDRNIIEGDGASYTCGTNIFQCPEYRFGGGVCFSDSTVYYDYVGRAGVCVEPPSNPMVIQSSQEGPYYTIQDESLDKDGCMDWCDSQEQCDGFIYWMWPYPSDISNAFADYEVRSNGGCRLFKNNPESLCTNVNATYTERYGLVSLYKNVKPTGCVRTSDWNTDEEYQDRCFMDLLRYWATHTDAKAGLAQNLIWSSGNYLPGPDDYLVGGQSESLITTGPLGEPLTGKVSEEAIQESRVVTDKYSDVGAFVTGIIYEYYDQLFEVNKYLFPSLCYIILSVYFCSFVFILHPLAALVMLLTLIATLEELWGLLFWLDIKVNGVLALNMVIACGVSVEFSAHINRKFMLATGTPRERLGTALGLMFIPVTSGAATSIIAVSFMAFSDLLYTRLYYFRLFSTMIAIGWWNGVFLQSVLLVMVAKMLEGTCMELVTIDRPQKLARETKRLEAGSEEIQLTDNGNTSIGDEMGGEMGDCDANIITGGKTGELDADTQNL